MTFQSLPTDLKNIVTDIAFGLTYAELKADVRKCALIQDAIPPSFLVAVLFHQKKWGYVNTPYKQGNAYHPTKKLDWRPVWNGIPQAFCCGIHKENIRELKTYKGIILRRLHTMLKQDFAGWNEMFHKVFSKLKKEHFRKNIRQSFVDQLLWEISDASALPEGFSF